MFLDIKLFTIARVKKTFGNRSINNDFFLFSLHLFNSKKLISIYSILTCHVQSTVNSTYPTDFILKFSLSNSVITIFCEEKKTWYHISFDFISKNQKLIQTYISPNLNLKHYLKSTEPQVSDIKVMCQAKKTFWCNKILMLLKDTKFKSWWLYIP